MSRKPKPHLTVKTINELAAPREANRLDIGDGRVSGLYLRVTQSGAKSFSILYRPRGSSRQRRMTLGRWPDAPGKQGKALERFRAEAQSLLAEVATGGDPWADRRAAAKRAPGDMTFEWLVDDYIQHEAKPAIKTWSQVEASIRRAWVPEIGSISIREVTRTDIYAVLRTIVADGRMGAAETARKHICRIFNYALDMGYVEMSPAQRLRIGALENHRSRARALDDEELHAISRAIDRIEQPWSAVFRVLLLTGARRSEIADATRRDLMPDGWLRVSADRYKTGREHSYFLVPKALEAISALPVWFPPDRSHVFSVRDGKEPIRGFARIKLRLDELASEELGRDIDPYRLHDFRVTVRTRLAGLGIPQPVAEAVIGHAKKGTERIYDQYHYRAERAEALEAWSEELDRLIGSEKMARRA